MTGISGKSRRRGSPLRAALTLCALCLTPPSVARAARHALVIGNSAYENLNKLSAPELDAQLMTQLLRRLGFDSVTVLTNANRVKMQEGIEAFLSHLDPTNDDTALLFFSGHGTSAYTANYLLPVDLPKQKDFERFSRVEWARAAVDVEMLLERTRVKAATTLFFLNNCLSTDYGVRGFYATQRLLDQKQLQLGGVTVPNLLISYATGPGQKAIASRKGEQRASPYTRHLVQNLLPPGVGLREALQRVRIAVLAETNRYQNPSVDDQLVSDVYLAGPKRPPWRLAIGGGVAGLGLALLGVGAYALAEDGKCADPPLCRTLNDSKALGGALLGLGLAAVAGGAAVAFVPRRPEQLEITLAPQGLGLRLALRF